MAVTLLIVPRSGSATRKLLRQRAAEASRYIKRQAAQTLDQASAALESCKEAVDKRKVQLGVVVEAGRDAYQVATRKLASAF